MFRIPFGKSPRYCDGVSRRSFLEVGLAGMGAVSLGQLLAMKDASAAATGAKNAGAPRPRTAAMVLSRSALACRVRRPDQCAQATAWAATQSVSLPGRLAGSGSASSQTIW